MLAGEVNATAKAKAKGKANEKEAKAKAKEEKAKKKEAKAKAKEEKAKKKEAKAKAAEEEAKAKLESGGRGKVPAINFGCLLQNMPAISGGTFVPIAIMRITAPCVNHHPPHSQHSKSMNSVATMRPLLWRREALKQAKLS
jgi:hypothetical protein